MTDVVEYDALPPELKAMIERVWADRMTVHCELEVQQAKERGQESGYDEGYSDGYNDGFESGVSNGRKEALLEYGASLCEVCGSEGAACTHPPAPAPRDESVQAA